MSVAKVTRDFVAQLKETKLFTYDDVPSDNKTSVAIELSRLYKKGVVKKVSKGKFYKPKQRAFGEVGPNSQEKLSKFIDATQSYETGFNSFRQLGLTTQLSKTTTIALNKPYRKLQIDNLRIQLIPKRVDAKEDEIYLVQMLDALKDIKKIPATTPSKAFAHLKEIISKESKENQNKLTQFAKSYTPRTRALLGAILKELGNLNCAYELKSTLNPLTKYKIDLDNSVVQQKAYWGIL